MNNESNLLVKVRWLRISVPKVVIRLVHHISRTKKCFSFSFTSFSGHRPAQREQARTGLIGPMQGAIPTQSHNP